MRISSQLYLHVGFLILQIQLRTPLFLPVNTGLAGLQLNFRTSCLKKIYV
ncbi:hypothetical protein UUU_19800 [Klebsiella pneumoniae subsp. pneumoniae DSM 30104 = JCM 1662 = NBRC 14940]|nr:hypothetical protein UUU_19800 [Klebsiella pneumoniae subsp. pneumoniae DSM 30104 = JCM 1662 = NBRC 14940]